MCICDHQNCNFSHQLASRNIPIPSKHRIRAYWPSKCTFALAMTRNEYGEAYEAGFDRTVRFLLSRGAQRDDAVEAAQAAWARGWERVTQLRDESLVMTWVNAIAFNFLRNGLTTKVRCHGGRVLALSRRHKNGGSHPPAARAARLNLERRAAQLH